MRRMAAFRAALRARSASFSRFRSSDSAKGVSRVLSAGLALGRAGMRPAESSHYYKFHTKKFNIYMNILFQIFDKSYKQIL